MSEPPFGPEDLKDPPLSGSEFLNFLQEEKARKYPAPPPFYQILYDGRLKPEQLKLWVKDMYVYWDHGLVYSTGAIFVKTNDEAVRTNILRKTVDLEGKDVVNDLTGWTTPAYEELWLRFGEGVGLPREEVSSWKSFTRTHYAISTLCMLSRWWEWSWLDGIASFYAGDLHGRDCLAKASEALKKFYRVPESSLEFFRVFQEDVVSHIPWEEQALSYWCCTRERQLTAAKAFRKRLDIENQLLVSVHRAATSERMPLQVP
jgi:pyrroloquinoline quinone (PQQ) biosynthesis protein C